MVDCRSAAVTLVDSAPALVAVAKNQATTSYLTVFTASQLLAFFSSSVTGCTHTLQGISTSKNSSYFELDANKNLMLKTTVSQQSAPEQLSVDVVSMIAVQ